MSQRLALKYICNTMVTSSFLGYMRLSIACAATDAQFQIHITLHENTLNHPDSNYAPHAVARFLSVA